MKEFIDKLIERLEEELNEIWGNTSLHHLYSDGCSRGIECAIEIINEIAEKYKSKKVNSDLISRSHVIKELNEIYLDNPWDSKEDILEKAIGIVEYINCSTDTSTDTSNGWIPCSERLPEVEADVLLSLRSLDVYTGFMANTERCFYVEGEGYVVFENVLAWKPLPAPYTEGE